MFFAEKISRFSGDEVVDWTQGGERTGQLRRHLGGPNSSLSIVYMSAESGPPSPEVIYTDNLVAAGHHDKHSAICNEKLSQLEDLWSTSLFRLETTRRKFISSVLVLELSY